jgi:hypothetical protein
MQIDGLPVTDATKPITLKITNTDVRMSHVKQPGACAAAKCCMRQMGVKAARVHVGRSYLLIGNKWLRYITTPQLRQEIIAFDRGGTFEPGDYTLNPIPAWEKKNRGKRMGSDAPGARDKGRKPKKRRTYHKVKAVRHSAKLGVRYG